MLKLSRLIFVLLAVSVPITGQILRRNPIVIPITGGGGGIAFVTQSTNTTQQPNAAFTNSLTGVSGSSLAVVVIVQLQGSGAVTVSGVTNLTGSQAFTQLWQGDSSGGVEAKTSGWILINPTGGSTLSIKYALSGNNVGAVNYNARVYSGVNQTGGVGNSWRTPPAVTGDGGGGNITKTVTTVSGDVVVMGVSNFGANITAVAGSNGAFMNNVEGTSYDFGFQDKPATTTSTVLTMTGGEFWSGGAAALIPAP